ncbi:MAG: glycosyltransferase family 39 protein [Prevotella sp.]|nr:glycosyltransferase family 39 protein [Prevotella sp.]
MQDSHHSINNKHITIYLLTAIYLVWLLAVLLFFGYTPTNDGVGYIELAQQCLTEHQPYPTVTIFTQVPFIWNIGIINLTELIIWLTGSIMPLLVLLCVMKAATAFFLSLTAERLFSTPVAIVALVLFIVYPNNWGQSTMVSSEIPSTCLSMIAVYLVAKGYGANGAIGANKPNRANGSLFFAGLLLALANWFRPTATIFMLCIILFLIVYQRKKSLRPIAELITGYIIFIAVVGTSTFFRTGRFLYQARSYWFSMVDECYDEATVAPHWGQPIWPEGTPRYIANRTDMDCFDYEQIWKKRSIDYLKNHKTTYLKKLPGRLYYMYQNDYDNMSAFLAEKSQPEKNFITIPFRHLTSEAPSLSMAQWMSLLCMLCYVAVLMMAILGTIVMLRRHRCKSLFLPLSIVVLGTLMLILLMHGETRFKDPLMPSLFMLAATSIPIKKAHHG